MDLTPELRVVALDALKAYLQALPISDGRTPLEIEAELDRNRIKVIEETLKPLVAKFILGAITLVDFKRQIDSANRQNQFWGFSGVKGKCSSICSLRLRKIQ